MSSGSPPIAHASRHTAARRGVVKTFCLQGNTRAFPRENCGSLHGARLKSYRLICRIHTSHRVSSWRRRVSTRSPGLGLDGAAAPALTNCRLGSTTVRLLVPAAPPNICYHFHRDMRDVSAPRVETPAESSPGQTTPAQQPSASASTCVQENTWASTDRSMHACMCASSVIDWIPLSD